MEIALLLQQLKARKEISETNRLLSEQNKLLKEILELIKSKQ